MCGFQVSTKDRMRGEAAVVVCTAFPTEACQSEPKATCCQAPRRKRRVDGTQAVVQMNSGSNILEKNTDLSDS